MPFFGSGDGPLSQRVRSFASQNSSNHGPTANATGRGSGSRVRPRDHCDIIGIMKKDDKTNVMRLLEQKKIPYEALSIENAEGLTGEEVALKLNENTAQAFKTLVTTGKTGNHYVFVIPVAEELDLKKAASAVGEKNIEMLKQKDLLPLTGYVHGGCSPIGMKKFFTTTIDESAFSFSEIYFSAGRIGCQVKVAVADIEKIIKVAFKDLTK